MINEPEISPYFTTRDNMQSAMLLSRILHEECMKVVEGSEINPTWDPAIIEVFDLIESCDGNTKEIVNLANTRNVTQDANDLAIYMTAIKIITEQQEG